jgi:glycosyltransferase involved in cell wall biosynthesis
MSNTPIISMGMYVYGDEAYIRGAIESLLAQDFKDFEIIISDDCSVDKTGDICEEYAKKDERIRFYRQPKNIGATSNMAFVAEQARGKYFMWSSGHDQRHPQFLSKCLKALEENPKAVLAYGGTKYFKSDGTTELHKHDSYDTRGRPADERLLYMLMALGSCNAIYALIRYDALKDVLRKFNLNVRGADGTVIFSLSLLGEFVYMPEPIYYRYDNHGNEAPEDKRKREIQIIRLSRFDVKRILPDLMRKYYVVQTPFRVLGISFKNLILTLRVLKIVIILTLRERKYYKKKQALHA